MVVLNGKRIDWGPIMLINLSYRADVDHLVKELNGKINFCSDFAYVYTLNLTKCGF